MRTGDFGGLQSSGNGFGMEEGTEEENDSTPFTLFEVMRMGWERRTDRDSETSGARVRVELPNNESARPDFSGPSEPSNTSVHGPATSIMIPVNLVLQLGGFQLSAILLIRNEMLKRVLLQTILQNVTLL